MDNGRNEADRLRVILETLAYAQPELKLEDALPVIWEIEERTLALESPGERASTYPKSHAPRDIADWINQPAQVKVRDFCFASQKINAIKEVRVITGMGLKEAKEGVEAWDRLYGTKA